MSNSVAEDDSEATVSDNQSLAADSAPAGDGGGGDGGGGGGGEGSSPQFKIVFASRDPGALNSGGGISFLPASRKFSYGFSSFQGERLYMEDFFETSISEVDGQMVAFFGVFDGHGGSRTAEYLKNNLFKNLSSHPDFIKDTKTAIVEVFKQTNDDYLEEGMGNQIEAGSTASTALLLRDMLFVANVGDSRVVACKAGSAIPLSIDHKPDRSDERERIERAGGSVVWAGTWRVNGILAVSRAFGDSFLEPFVIAEPEIQEEEIDGVDFIIVATDGLWNVMSNEEAVKIVKNTPEAEEASRKLVKGAYSKGSTDNITCVIVRFDVKVCGTLNRLLAAFRTLSLAINKAGEQFSEPNPSVE